MVYDCFVFFNEIDLLKIRLSLYYKIVDYFVICECSKTQRNEVKPFYFENNKHLFSDFLDKIIYVKADNPPVSYNCTKESEWLIENYQRNAIAEGLKNCKKDDLIFISDLDEFWNPAILTNQTNFYVDKFQNMGYGRKYKLQQSLKLGLKNPFLLFSRNLKTFLKSTPVVLDQDFFYYFINYKRNERWHGTIMLIYKNIQSIQKLRDQRNLFPVLHNDFTPCGWHFSYLGGKQKIKEKLKAIVEGGQCKADNLDEWIDFCLANRVDLYNRSKIDIAVASIDSLQLPILDYIKTNYTQFIYTK